MKFKHTVITGILCAAMALTGCSAQEDEVVEENPGTSVETLAAEKGNIENDYVYSGKIASSDELNVFSTIQGTVSTVNFEVGDWVNQGDVLFTMDTEAYQISKKQLQASLTAANASAAQAQLALNNVDGASYQMNVESLKTALNNAENNFNNVSVTYENNKILFEQGIISKTDMDNSELAYNQAKNAYEQAKTSYDLTSGQLLEESRKTAQAALNSASASTASIYAQIEAVDKSIRDSVITAPISGTVTACNVKANELLSSAAVPFTITDTSKLKINVNVSQRIINTVNVGDEVSVRTEAVDNTIKGVVKTVNPAANSGGTYAVEIELDNSLKNLKPGMFAEVSFTNEKGDDKIVVIRDAVITKNSETYVFVDENGVAVKKMVETGIDDGTSIQITSGLVVGDMVVVKGQTYLSEGDKLSVKNGTSSADDATSSSVSSSETKGE